MKLTPGTDFQKLRTSMGYPDVPLPEQRYWTLLPPGYRAVEYTARSVKRAMPDWKNPDLEAVWARAQRLSSRLLFRDGVSGRPLNPAGPTGVSGHGRLRYLGPNWTADGLVTHGDKVLLIERSDTRQLAFPGGFLDPLANGKFEDPLKAAVREVYEETDIRAIGKTTLLYSGIAPLSLRNTDNAWIENKAYHIDVSRTPANLLVPRAKDDAISAAWFPLFELDFSLMSDDHVENAMKLQGQVGQ
jgi:ADP-ribose pyrophosphatase YjhB (NUDIX family)